MKIIFLSIFVFALLFLMGCTVPSNEHNFFSSYEEQSSLSQLEPEEVLTIGDANCQVSQIDLSPFLHEDTALLSYHLSQNTLTITQQKIDRWSSTIEYDIERQIVVKEEGPFQNAQADYRIDVDDETGQASVILTQGADSPINVAIPKGSALAVDVSFEQGKILYWSEDGTALAEYDLDEKKYKTLFASPTINSIPFCIAKAECLNGDMVLVWLSTTQNEKAIHCLAVLNLHTGAVIDYILADKGFFCSFSHGENDIKRAFYESSTLGPEVAYLQGPAVLLDLSAAAPTFKRMDKICTGNVRLSSNGRYLWNQDQAEDGKVKVTIYDLESDTSPATFTLVSQDTEFGIDASLEISNDGRHAVLYQGNNNLLLLLSWESLG